MKGFDQRTLTTTRGYTYTYYITLVNENDTCHGDTTDAPPTLLFHHGWPDHAEVWSGIATAMREDHQIPNRILIPDMLGYGGTSKPTDPAAYEFHGMTNDMVEILEHESISAVISIGHDWGSRAAARLYNYHPSRVAGMILLNVAYMPPQREPFSLEASNAATERAFGYPCLAYWELFTAPDGPQILKDHVDRLFNAMHGDVERLKSAFCTYGGMRAYLTSSHDNDDDDDNDDDKNNSTTSTNSTHSTTLLRPYAQDPAFKRAFIERMTRDGFDAPLCWYRAVRDDNVQLRTDARLPRDRDTIHVPLLYVSCKDDAVCRPEFMIPAKQNGLVPLLEESPVLDAGHWCPYEIPDQVAAVLVEWLVRKGFCGLRRGEVT